MRWRLAAVASLMGGLAWAQDTEAGPADRPGENIALAQAIREADTGVRIWENPNHRDMDQANQAMIDACHVLSPHRQIFLNEGQGYRDYCVQKRDQGIGLEFYSAWATRLFDMGDFQLPGMYFTPEETWTLAPGYENWITLWEDLPNKSLGMLYQRPIGGRCIECHAATAMPVGSPAGFRFHPDSFELAQGDRCTECHMPDQLASNLPMHHEGEEWFLSMANHRIGIFKDQ